MAKSAKAYESPLISHDRMRAMYRAMLELHAVQGKKKPLTPLSPATLTAAVIGLEEGDLTSDTGAPGHALLLAHIRAVGGRERARAPRKNELSRLRKSLQGEPDASFPGSPADRLLCAAGAGMALQALGDRRVMVAFAGPGELDRPSWLRFLPVLAQKALPVVLILLPQPHALDLEALQTALRRKSSAAQPGSANALGLPIIPVDGNDPVALYRVAQECIGRARAGGGASVLEAVPSSVDPVQFFGQQLVRKGICTPSWIAQAQNGLAS